jgi:hypothetical protein
MRSAGLLLAIAMLAEAQMPSLTARIRVPATANPYLAGMPAGTRARRLDIAPDQSPVMANLPPGSVAVSFEAAGAVQHAPYSPPQYDSPEGSTWTEHEGGAEHGISDIHAPMDSLVGVFLGDEPPDRSAAPKELKVKNAGRDLKLVTPQLKQVFFIGTGKTKAGVTRRFLVPNGATRLFLGVMDGWDWNNNNGEFRVVITLERAAVSSSLFSVDSKMAFAEWACLPGRAQCTPEEAVVKDLGGGRYRVVLPAYLVWGASVPTPHGVVAQIREATGIVCLDAGARSSCNGPEGNGNRSDGGLLVRGEPAGALVMRRAGDRTEFSVNGHPGPAFAKQEGFFEFEVMVGGSR